MVQVAVLGYGTVGSGVVKVIDTNHDSILEKTGIDLNVKYILDLRDFPGDPNQDKIVFLLLCALAFQRRHRLTRVLRNCF